MVLEQERNRTKGNKQVHGMKNIKWLYLGEERDMRSRLIKKEGV